jgi:hypothetical protein
MACPSRENAPHYVVDGNIEGQGDLLRDPWASPLGFRCFISTTAATTSWLGPFGPGFVAPLDENSQRYFL